MKEDFERDGSLLLFN